MNASEPEGGAFGGDVKRVRKARGLSQDGLAFATGYSRTYVSKVESGTLIPAARFAEGCDKAFGTGDLFARQLRRVTEGEHPEWFAPYIELEREASTVRDFSTVFIMGLLQTPEYARGVFEIGWNRMPTEEAEAQITSRLRRREVLEQAPPPQVSVIMHEACLRAQIGSARTMVGQLTHVLGLLKVTHMLTVQVLPYSAAGAAANTPFTILGTPDGAMVVHSEGPSGGRLTDAANVVASSQGIFDHLRSCALSPKDSVIYLKGIKDDHERDARVEEVQLQRLQRGPVRRVGPGTRVRRRHPRPRQ